MDRLAAILVFFFLVFVVGTLCAAPVPVARSPKLIAGFPTDTWIRATWYDSHWAVRFEADGRYRSRYDGSDHEGTWTWTPKTRTLRIVERQQIIRGGEINYGPWSAFTVVLDYELRGRTNYGIKVDFSGVAKLK